VGECGTAREATDDYIIQRMRIDCWIIKDKHTHSEYKIPIAFPLQPWLGECVFMLHYTHIASCQNFPLFHSGIAATNSRIYGKVILMNQLDA